jgi:hypothetical protein
MALMVLSTIIWRFDDDGLSGQLIDRCRDWLSPFLGKVRLSTPPS